MKKTRKNSCAQAGNVLEMQKMVNGHSFNDLGSDKGLKNKGKQERPVIFKQG